MALGTKLPLLKTVARGWRVLVVAMLYLGAACAQAPVDSVLADPALTLRARHIAMQDALRDSAFGRPLQLESREFRSRLEGDVYAVTEHDFASVAAVVTASASWCEILSLHLNVKRCSATPGSPVSRVIASVGGKRDGPRDAAYGFEFAHRTDLATSDYIRVVLDAGTGPFGTRDHRIVLEATPAGPRTTFIHLSYSHAYGPLAALAMRAYLGTAGASKVGFTVIGRQPDGRPVLVGGLRGALERNTMRYFLALEACLDAHAVPDVAAAPERRFLAWFAATERYPQLHELSLDEYLELKQPQLPASATSR
jgi:hypothetical protein